MNEIACKDCVFFDLQYRGTIRGQRPTKHALCAARSTYPAEEQDTQVFHPQAKRVAPGELAKPVLVWADAVVRHCTQAIRKGR